MIAERVFDYHQVNNSWRWNVTVDGRLLAACSSEENAKQVMHAMRFAERNKLFDKMALLS